MHIDLRRVKVTPRERERYVEMMGNWDNLYSQLTASIERGETGEAEVLKMLKVEVTTKRRLAIASRLLAAYHRLAKAENERRLAAAISR